MGGGVSLIEGVEELVTTTYLIGRAISAIQFPGMYRIYDFHSKLAPKIKNAQRFSLFAPDSDDEEVAESDVIDSSLYSHFFRVLVGEDNVYIENPIFENGAGWTALHACCMSFTTVNAGIALIDETIRLGGSLDVRTKVGPGTFNKGWTPLQMACAYGIEPLVEKLVQSGADVNAVNSYGYSCMLEACHRGFINIIKSLLKKYVDLSYIPPEDVSLQSPFASSPSQSPLAESARCGFFKVVELLLDEGAPKDLPNSIGWTALHEACFFNRLETVKTLLLYGANPTLRTKIGALPYHLASLPEIKQMLESMGGVDAVPKDGDIVNMIMILTELTNCQVIQIGGGNEEDSMLTNGNIITIGNGNRIHNTIEDSKQNNIDAIDDDINKEEKYTIAKEDEEKSTPHYNKNNNNNNNKKEEKESLLHSGGILGNLPALNVNKNKNSHNSPNKQVLDSNMSNELDKVFSGNNDNNNINMNTFTPVSSSHLNYSNNNNKQIFHAGGSSNSNNRHLLLNNNNIKNNYNNISSKADDKKFKNSNKNNFQSNNNIPTDFPREYLCQLTMKPMSEPVKTTYGNVYDKTAILNWFSVQGKICPLTGAPLSEIDLTPLEDLGEEIRSWILKKSSTSISDENTTIKTPLKTSNISNTTNRPHHQQEEEKQQSKATAKDVGDDLYDF